MPVQVGEGVAALVFGAPGYVWPTPHNGCDLSLIRHDCGVLCLIRLPGDPAVGVLQRHIPGVGARLLRTPGSTRGARRAQRRVLP